jgi:hypothetical protein
MKTLLLTGVWVSEPWSPYNIWWRVQTMKLLCSLTENVFVRPCSVSHVFVRPCSVFHVFVCPCSVSHVFVRPYSVSHVFLRPCSVSHVFVRPYPVSHVFVRPCSVSHVFVCVGAVLVGRRAGFPGPLQPPHGWLPQVTSAARATAPPVPPSAPCSAGCGARRAVRLVARSGPRRFPARWVPLDLLLLPPSCQADTQRVGSVSAEEDVNRDGTRCHRTNWIEVTHDFVCWQILCLGCKILRRSATQLISVFKNQRIISKIVTQNDTTITFIRSWQDCMDHMAGCGLIFDLPVSTKCSGWRLKPYISPAGRVAPHHDVSDICWLQLPLSSAVCLIQ